jgi:hypothetical protein
MSISQWDCRMTIIPCKLGELSEDFLLTQAVFWITMLYHDRRFSGEWHSIQLTSRDSDAGISVTFCKCAKVLFHLTCNSRKELLILLALRDSPKKSIIASSKANILL